MSAKMERRINALELRVSKKHKKMKSMKKQLKRSLSDITSLTSRVYKLECSLKDSHEREKLLWAQLKDSHERVELLRAYLKDHQQVSAHMEQQKS